MVENEKSFNGCIPNNRLFGKLDLLLILIECSLLPFTPIGIIQKSSKLFSKMI